jgi:hypothetical protein
MGGNHIGGMGHQAFGSAGTFRGRGVHAGLHGRHGRRFRGFGGYDNYNPCWDWQYGSYYGACQYPNYY